MTQSIELFLQSPAFAVIGASSNKDKYGNKVLRCYLQHNKTVYPVNPHEKIIENVSVVSTIADLPQEVESISIITPPSVTEKIVIEAIAKGIKNIWMQPGAENEKAIQNALNHGINVIAGGPCILVVLGFKE
jgi:predicted CoA-binding protein